MPIKLKTNGRDVMRDDYLLTENPFRSSEIFSVDRTDTYVPEIYGDQYAEFYKKFFLLPLSREKNKQVIGAVWSSHVGDDLGKGYGKSFLMYQESVEINADFGAEKLRKFNVGEEDIVGNPFVAGYCTFDQSKDVKTFPAALLDAVAFILESKHGDENVHQALRNRIIANIEVDEGFESEAIYMALQKELRRFRGLNIQLNHKTVADFIDKLCHDDTNQLISVIRHTIGPRVKAAQGFNFVHIFNAFLRVAGVFYVTYFVDQIENFARFVKKNHDRDLKILRESMCQTSPTDDMASFVFQMHVHALNEIEGWWDNVEHLPSLDPKKPINSARVVDLKGLTNRQEGEILAARRLEERRPLGAKPPQRLHPFDSDIIEAVRQSAKGNPRRFREKLGEILSNGELNQRRKIDLAFVTPFLDDDNESISYTDDQDDELANLER